MNIGLFYGFTAYLCWGLMPLLWKQMLDVPATSLVAHRVIWCFLCLLPIALLFYWADIKPLLTGKRLAQFVVTTALLTSNWLLFIWCVNNDRVLEASLAYYINPLVSVCLAVAILQEQMSRIQWLAVALATTAVFIEGWQLGRVPIFALLMALTFALYGLQRKRMAVPTLPGLSVETAFAVPFAALALFWMASDGQPWLGDQSSSTLIWIALCGPATAVPLLFFGAAATRVRLATLGIMQYLAPSLMLIIGVFVYQEPFSYQRAIAFVLLWIALIVYLSEDFRVGRQTKNK